jgi:hypothetical protein
MNVLVTISLLSHFFGHPQYLAIMPLMLKFLMELVCPELKAKYDIKCLHLIFVVYSLFRKMPMTY